MERDSVSVFHMREFLIKSKSDLDAEVSPPAWVLKVQFPASVACCGKGNRNHQAHRVDVLVDHWTHRVDVVGCRVQTHDGT